MRENRLSKPSWIRTKWQITPEAKNVRRIIREQKMHTVCEESSCPNRGDCYNRGTCTFLIMGAICTRGCRFCDVTSGHPLPLDPGEPRRTAESVRDLGVRYVVLTSVDRDDMPDGGAAHFAQTVREIHTMTPHVKVEVLTPDFAMNLDAIHHMLDSHPDVFAHNVETVERLTPRVRDRRANYRNSLEVLRIAVEYTKDIPVKSGVMVGLGETDEEIYQTIKDIRQTGASSITIGQYLSPTKKHLPIDRYVTPETFAEYEKFARDQGFIHVASGPLVRSSFHADEMISHLDSI